MRRVNRSLTIICGIILLIASGGFSALLATGHVTAIHNFLSDIVLLLLTTAASCLPFLVVYLAVLRGAKKVLERTYAASFSARDMDSILRYPFRAIPLIVAVQTACMALYLAAGEAAHILSISRASFAVPGIILSALPIMSMAVFSFLYLSKLATNPYIAKAIKKTNAVEVKSVTMPVSYKILVVFGVSVASMLIAVTFAVSHNADLYLRKSIRDRTMQSLSVINGTVDNNPDADKVLKAIADGSPDSYGVYLYRLSDGSVTSYSGVPLRAGIPGGLKSGSPVPDRRIGQTLFFVDKPVSIDGAPCIVVLGVKDSLYKKTASAFTVSTIGTGVFILLLGFILAILIATNLSSHEKRIADYTGALSGRRPPETRDMPPPDILATDELGLISMNLRTLVQNFKESKSHLLSHAAGMSDLAASARAQAAGAGETGSAQSARADGLRATIDSIREAFRHVTDLGTPLRDETIKAGERLSGAIQENKEILKRINASSVHLSRTSKLTAAYINTYEDIRQHIARLRGTVVSLGSLTHAMDGGLSRREEMIKDMSGTVDGIKSLNDRARAMAMEAGTLLSDTMSLSEGTSSLLAAFLEHIMQSDEILGIINNVAQRTNLLSVNALILASSSQTGGRSFRVVAEEIKKLAGRARAGSRDISSHLAKVRRNISEISASIKSMDDIIAVLRDSFETLDAVSRAIEEMEARAGGAHGAPGGDQKTDAVFTSAPVEVIDKLMDALSAATGSLAGIDGVFNKIKDTLIQLTGISNAHYSTLMSAGNSIDAIKTFTGYINENLAIDAKEQTALLSDSADVLSAHAKGSVQGIAGINGLMDRLGRELEELRKNAGLLIA